MKIRKSFLFVCLAVSLSMGSGDAADLMRVLPVTRDVLVLHIREGHIDYNGVDPKTGQCWYDWVIDSELAPMTKAAQKL